MQFSYTADSLWNIDADVVVCFTPKLEKISDRTLKFLDDASGGMLTSMLESEEFEGKKNQVVTLYNLDDVVARRVVIAGLGQKGDVDHDRYRQAMGTVSRQKAVQRSKSMAIYFGRDGDTAHYQAAVEGYFLGSYKLLDYKTGDDARHPSVVERITCAVDSKSALSRLEKAVERGRVLAEGQVLARTLAMTPSNKLTPTLYAEKAKELARQYKVKCRVLDQKAIEKENMGALLSVSRGSDEPPQFIILEYNGGPDKQAPIVLVGKGVTFDSGGISLKPGLNMHEMKQDMAGSAAVIATILTAARLGINRNIITLVPTVENMPSGRATRPGDIITSRKGKTVEIINTDAEGRLILADALDYANKFDPQAVIDVATLTGATLYILGYSGAPVMGNNDKLKNLLRTASEATAERIWELPLWDDFRDQMKSSIADLVNSGGRPAGTAAAGAFLENFIGDWPWAHIDIAYVDLEPKGRAYTPKGASGFGVRLLIEALSNWKKP